MNGNRVKIIFLHESYDSETALTYIQSFIQDAEIIGVGDTFYTEQSKSFKVRSKVFSPVEAGGLIPIMNWVEKSMKKDEAKA